MYNILDFPDSFHSWNFLSSIGSGITFLSFAIFSLMSWNFLSFLLYSLLHVFFYLYILCPVRRINKDWERRQDPEHLSFSLFTWCSVLWPFHGLLLFSSLSFCYYILYFLQITTKHMLGPAIFFHLLLFSLVYGLKSKYLLSSDSIGNVIRKRF